MSIPSRLSSYLDQRGTHYTLCMHDRSHSSAETARMMNIPPHQLAKSVVLEDDAGCVLAVVPADKSVMLDEAGRMLGRKDLRLCDEDRVAALFGDCDRGAVPAIGMAWDLQTLVDDELQEQRTVYLEAGDHECALQMSGEQFQALMRPAAHGHFCRASMH